MELTDRASDCKTGVLMGLSTCSSNHRENIWKVISSAPVFTCPRRAEDHKPVRYSLNMTSAPSIDREPQTIPCPSSLRPRQPSPKLARACRTQQMRARDRAVSVTHPKGPKGLTCRRSPRTAAQTEEIATKTVEFPQPEAPWGPGTCPILSPSLGLLAL